MKRHLPIILVAALIASAAPAAEPFATDGTTRILWKELFATPQNDWINHLLLLKNGNILVTGFTGRDDTATAPDWRALAATLTRDGRLVWRTDHGDGGGVDAFWAAAEGGDGKLHTAGFTNRIGAGGLDAFLATLKPDGTLHREITQGGPAYDRVTDIVAVPGGFVAAGFTTEEGKGRDVLLVKTDDTGQLVWFRSFGGPKDDDALYIKPTADGGLVIAGGTEQLDEGGDVLVMKLDEMGREVWRKVIGAPGTLDVPHSLSIHKDGRIQVTGYTESYGSREHDLLAITLAPNGDLLHQEVFGGAGDDRAMVGAIDDQDRTWITGYTKSAGAGGYDIFIARLDKDGRFEERLSTIGGALDDNGTMILPLNDGTLLLSAYSRNLGQGGEDAVVMRISEPEWTSPPAGFLRRVVQ